jgi:hypothetical protein
VLSVR